MKLKSVLAGVSTLALLSGLSISTASAANIVNGSACSKAKAVATVKVKGISKTYICKINPSVTGATKPTWTLKTCITYWAAAMASQKSIDDQLALVKVMSEPDKTTYTNQLADSQLALNKVKASIVSNHCQAGL